MFRYRITILRAMLCASVLGCVLGLLLRNWNQLDPIMEILSLIVFAGAPLLAVHFAIEANRREDRQRQRSDDASS